MWNYLKITILLIGVASLATNVVQSSVPTKSQQFRFSSATKPMGINSCVECHPKICEKYPISGISQTQIPANDPEMLKRYAGREFTMPESGIHSKFFEKEGELFIESDAYPFPMRVDLIFGSGIHAQTPVTLFQSPNGEPRLFTHKISWYPNDTVDVTLGMEHYDYPTGRKTLGEFLDPATTRNCLSCHLTHLPVKENRLSLKNISHNVMCERCHLHGEKHIAEANDESAFFSRKPWKELTPLESVNQCGECHRRADQLTEEEINPDDELLIRFASVGIAMSKCFLEQGDNPSQDKRLDCMTCHDPHGELIRDPQHYVDKCLKCHASESGGAKDCRAQPMTSNCMTCHLPTVKVQKNLAFTDHWIRIRTEKDPKAVKKTKKPNRKLKSATDSKEPNEK